MLDTSEPDAVKSFNLLQNTIIDAKRPIIYWIGAGTSSWCGYPRWDQLAQTLHSYFTHNEPKYDANDGLKLLNAGELPQFFGVCKAANPHTYLAHLTSQLQIRPPSALFQRFARCLNKHNTRFVLTTNADQLLEKHLNDAEMILGKDIERARRLLDNNQSFVCKLHGCISNADSLVFTKEEYDSLTTTDPYTEHLRQILGRATVVFIGYGLRDQYLLETLSRNESLSPLLGDGPHFTISQQGPVDLPANIRHIKCLESPRKDHRYSLTILEDISFLQSTANTPMKAPPPTPTFQSRYFLSQVLRPGTITTSQTLNVIREDGGNRKIIVGVGFNKSELSTPTINPGHDLLVGLTCYDTIVGPLNCAPAIHDLVGSDRFWHLVNNDILQFTHWPTDQAILVNPDCNNANGDIGQILNPRHSDPGEFIRTQFTAAPGKESEVEKLFAGLESKLIPPPNNDSFDIPRYTRSLLQRPEIRQALGISMGMPTNSIPEWLVFPILRLAWLVRVGCLSEHLRAASAKVDFGIAALAGPAFSIKHSQEFADPQASYVLGGSYSANLGALLSRSPEMLDAVLNFRDTSEGERFRRDVLESLSDGQGANIEIAINGALSSALPAAALEAARNRFESIYTQNSTTGSPATSFAIDVRNTDQSLALWRNRSHKTLMTYIATHKIQAYDPCPCGSGEQLKFCCLQSLKHSP